MKHEVIERYLSRHGLVDDEHVVARPGLRAAVVIPAKAERQNLPEVLESLAPLPSWAEVIVVVNHGIHSTTEVIEDNYRTAEWLAKRPQTVVIDRYSEGREIREGGVGRARRIGMDTALARLRESGAERAFITCLDADSPVDPGYLEGIDAFFDGHPEVLAGVCHYEHQTSAEPALDEAIVEYEIWLRYWEEGLRAACSPYAFQNLGSCIVASASGYAAVDGMPQLSSAQDFYFLEKVVKCGGPGAVATLPEVVVRPSARPSRRVPHGTGRALADILDGRARKYREVPPASAFFDLRDLLTSLEELFRDDALLQRLAPELTDFLMRRCGGRTAIPSMRDTAPDAARFVRSFHAWFSASRQIQYANEAADVRGRMRPEDVCQKLLENGELQDGRELLHQLRSRARSRT